MSVADLELRSVVCVPLIQVRTGSLQETVATSLNNTVGVLYMDSRGAAADLSAGNREILQTLALEASTILENARLLEEERAKQHMEEELNIARTIQTGLLPSELPTEGWFRAVGSSIASARWAATISTCADQPRHVCVRHRGRLGQRRERRAAGRSAARRFRVRLRRRCGSTT
jgi:GAF domain-containing protein